MCTVLLPLGDNPNAVNENIIYQYNVAGPSRRAIYSVGLEPLALLGLWVRIPPGTGRLTLESVVFCQVEVPASG